jgi:hypothetical protein
MVIALGIWAKYVLPTKMRLVAPNNISTFDNKGISLGLRNPFKNVKIRITSNSDVPASTNIQVKLRII